ncbi:hypothetical protein [Polaribacter sp. WD7]|uniref:HYC_CC_PP family protein n=1 Tax=Polaribacter sp. WD7 TaxID=2269061 RepID=UPI0021630F04|nr:hypothetical protein [Polaribacter sp. WD7]
MKQVFVKITSIILALFVLFSTFSFTVEKHYCGDFLMDVSFTGDADDCTTVMKASKSKCCKDEVYQIEGQDELQQFTSHNFDFEKTQFLVAFYISYQDLFVVDESDKVIHIDFPPPDIPKNFQVLHQSFLI